MLKRIEAASNVAVLCVALLLVFVIVKEHVLRPSTSTLPTSANSDARLVGASLNIKGIKWSESPSTLVIALSSSCRFCLASVPFYQRLTELKKAGGVKTRLVAVFPQTAAAANAFLAHNNISADVVSSVSLEETGIEATPNLLLVNSLGTVQRQWTGLLPDALQKDVIAALSNGGRS